MITIETKKLEISQELRDKVDKICAFANVKAKYIPGEIKSFKGSNLAYVRPHIVIINNNDYLIFEKSNYIFVNGYDKKITFPEFRKLILLTK